MASRASSGASLEEITTRKHLGRILREQLDRSPEVSEGCRAQLGALLERWRAGALNREAMQAELYAQRADALLAERAHPYPSGTDPYLAAMGLPEGARRHLKDENPEAFERAGRARLQYQRWYGEVADQLGEFLAVLDPKPERNDVRQHLEEILRHYEAAYTARKIAWLPRSYRLGEFGREGTILDVARAFLRERQRQAPERTRSEPREDLLL